VPRPDLISRLHEAKYEMQMGLFGTKADRFARYDALLTEAAALYKCSKYELRQALNEDYRAWIRENRLPRPPLARLSLLEAEIGYFSREVDRRGS
jgi:hypothetical protein